MDIINLVRELLQLHDCVVIPDFGGFITNYCPARLDSQRNIFTPPGKEIVFNGKLIKNDGLFISSIVEQKGVGYSVARSLVAEFVEELFLKMENGEKVMVPGVGYLYFDKRLNIQFEPEANNSFSLDSFGLDSFHFAPAGSVDVLPKIEKLTAPKKVNGNITKKTIKRVAVTVPLMALLMMAPVHSRLSHPLSSSEASPLSLTSYMQNTSVENIAKEDTVLIAEELNDDVVIEIAVNKKTEFAPTAAIVPAKQFSPRKQVNDGRYYLIVGSFSSRVNAVKLCNTYIKKYFNPEIIEDNGLFRVSLNTHDNKQAAVNEIRTITGDDPAIPVWLHFKN